jgi:chlorophyllide a reductase subunit Z
VLVRISAARRLSDAAEAAARAAGAREVGPDHLDPILSRSVAA